MKKFSILLLIGLFSAFNLSAQLLYKISGNGLDKSSYIVGTHHLTDASFADSIPDIKSAMANVKAVYGEVITENMTQPDTVLMMMETMKLPDGKTIKDVLTTEQFSKLNEFFKQNMGMPLDNQLIFSKMGQYSPVAMSTIFEGLLYAKNHPMQSALKGIDSYFQEKAKEEGKKIGGLETMSEQCHILFQSVPMEQQVKDLMCMVENPEYASAILDDITKAYHAQDLEALEKVSNESDEYGCDSSEEENKLLIDNRNANWLNRMPAIMKSQPTLFVVGALHLPGENGVLQLLRNAGYTVKGVK